MTEENYRRADIALKLVAFAGSFFLAFLAWNQFTSQQEKQFHAYYYQQKIEGINKVIKITEKIRLAKTEEKKAEIANEIWAVHYGYAMIYFSHELNDSMREVKEYVNKCYQKSDVLKIYEVDCTKDITFYLPAFSNAARKELASSMASLRLTR